jgi:hypothetical protein
VLTLDDKSILYVSSDDEGNNGGALFMVDGDNWFAVTGKDSAMMAKGGKVSSAFVDEYELDSALTEVLDYGDYWVLARDKKTGRAHYAYVPKPMIAADGSYDGSMSFDLLSHVAKPYDKIFEKALKKYKVEKVETEKDYYEKIVDKMEKGGEAGISLDGTKKYKYSITFRTITEESAEQGDWDKTGYEIEERDEELQYIIKTAHWDYGINYFTGSWWESTSPTSDRDYFEKGIEKYYDLHIRHTDGSELSKAEEEAITDLFKNNKVKYDEDEKRWWSKGGAINSGINWIITGTYI